MEYLNTFEAISLDFDSVLRSNFHEHILNLIFPYLWQCSWVITDVYFGRRR